MPGPVSLVIAMFNIPGNNLNINTPNVNFPQMPSVSEPSFQGPTFQGPTIDSSGIQGPYMQGPQVQGPYYNGPQMPGQSYAGSSSAPSTRSGSEGRFAGFWLGVLIFVWTLAIASLVVLGMYLAGLNINPFNFQHYKAQNAMSALTANGAEVAQPAAYGSSGGFGSTQVPFKYVDGYNFTVPSSGPTGAGGIVSFSSSSDLDSAKAWLSDTTKTGAVPYRIYTKDNILLYLNVSSQAKADQYNTALQTMK